MGHFKHHFCAGGQISPTRSFLHSHSHSCRCSQTEARLLNGAAAEKIKACRHYEENWQISSKRTVLTENTVHAHKRCSLPACFVLFFSRTAPSISLFVLVDAAMVANYSLISSWLNGPYIVWLFVNVKHLLSLCYNKNK